MSHRMFFAAATAMALFNAPAFAQTETPAPAAADAEKINTVIVYGDDKCQESTDDTINVCARLPESDRYRIPTPLRGDLTDPRKEAWTNRVLAYEFIGREGTMSCSPTGAGGFTGCGLKQIDAAYAEKEADPGLAFGRMIAAERRKRLAAIDAEAELVEQRVIQFEKERAEREARQAGQATETETPESDLPQPK
ncbi:MAG: hypothetical protein ACRCY3_16585 [Sphingorhabdus sp.]